MLSSFAPLELPQLSLPTIRRLPNGLTIIAEQMPTEAISLDVWLRAGSAHEADEINGLAHFLEHMIFKGTHDLQTGEFERRIEARGAVTNAATSQDYTHFYLVSAPQDFAALAPLQIQMVMNPRLTEADFDRERSVILEEIRQAEDNPRRRTFYRSMEMTFDRLPYRRPVLGSVTADEALTVQQMRAFHGSWYQPGNMTVVAVGNLPVETLINTVSEGFEQATRQCLVSPQRSQPEPGCQLESPFEEVCRASYSDRSLQQARLVMSWRVPGVAHLADTYALDVAASILGRGRTSRLVHHLREEQKLVAGISASNMTFSHQGVFYVAAVGEVEQLAAIEAAIAHHIAAIGQQPVTTAELERVRTQVANRYIFGSETPSDRAGLYGYYQTMTQDLSHALNYPHRIRQISPEQIQAAAQQYLKPDAYGLVVMKPEE
ncbi:peptidase M16 [filamentous cyanobacterium CCP5]|nr:peptidase M16 [filamentous cyanobacterium CCP5]